MFNERGVLFWPVGTGDSTTFVIKEDEVMFQVDLRSTTQAEDDESDQAPIVDRLVEHLPQRGDMPYLSGFALTHPDEDHILGFSDLLEQVTIGELWFTPRVFREHDDDDTSMCDDAQAFRDEAHRRVEAAIKAGGDPGDGNRVRLIGYDTLLEEDQYKDFPSEFFSIPGNTVTELDGEDLSDDFRVFIHGPFKKDEIVGDRNDTSLVMQVVLGADPEEGGVLLFGDHKYPTIREILDITTKNNNEENLKWQILLAPHHCSKSVMYQTEDEKEVLKQDILDDLDRLQVGDGVIVASSLSVPSTNKSGDNPPHAKAKDRYSEIAGGGFVCTHDDGDSAEALLFVLDGANLVQHDADSAQEQSDTASKSALLVGVKDSRGSDDVPQDKLGFGSD
ncbi:hypothetical protein [uncultured Parasphingorhabdus sp.]|uniref:hypothetical protein n=1 Tax=uncultured Parasphingorhabdus sp. TaxID=2709694 RepID=UPI002AA6E8CA|nr:hypothetical protein [uncultured Parasphingorhabdus sp.]